ncbi:MAG: hypothetical protein LUE29_03320 [Lachnospiraceae bacterium]|nr:hypothetical protein [Lachnospiraceae bacterium]
MNRTHKILNITIVLLCVLLVALLGCIIYYGKEQGMKEEARLQQLQEEQDAIQDAAEEATMLTLFEDESVNLAEGFQSKRILGHTDLSQCATYVSGYYTNASVKFNISDIMPATDESKLYMLVFEAYSESSCVKIAVHMNDDTSYYYLTSEPSAFYLPISDFENFSITLISDFQNIYIGNMQIIETDGIDSGIYYGQYCLSDFERYAEDDAVSLNSLSGRDIILNGDYLYYLSNDRLVIYEIDNDNITEAGALTGLGTTRQMDFIDDSTIVITARENDVYFVDVSNPEDPFIVSTYDSLDLATGVSACENYVFICSRYFGVEVVDVSDVTKPQCASIISTGAECYDCLYSNGYLYISNWSSMQVMIYDINNPNQPKEKYTIDVDGKPAGLAIENGMLFVATGQNSANDSSDVLSSGYGAGHGMEIYDVSDPENVEWLSTVKIDGRLLYLSADHWNVHICGDYAFLASTYGGVYIYDVSDLKDPVRIGMISTPIESDSNLYYYTENETSIFPYDVDEYIEDPISSIVFGDGVVYLAGWSTGLYSIEFDFAETSKIEVGGVLPESDGSYFESINETPLKSSVLYINECSVNAVDVADDYIYLACGDSGVEIINNNGELISSIETAGAAQDIVLKDGYAYVAEGNYGIEVYKIDETKISLISSWQCELSSESVTEIRIIGNYMIAQTGWTYIRLFDISSPSLIEEVEYVKTGTMYLKNLINTDSKSSFFGFSNGIELRLYSITDMMQEVVTVDNSLYGERNGICEYEGNLIAIYKNGYVIVPIDEIRNDTDLSVFEKYSLGNDYPLKGLVSCYDNVMVVTNATGKQVNIVDITDITSPSIISSFSVSGNPLIAKITDDYIYIPLCWQGLLIIER